jgi:hypothetical protein
MSKHVLNTRLSSAQEGSCSAAGVFEIADDSGPAP